MFLVSSLFFFVWFPCGRLSWLHVSFWAHVNIVHHIISYIIVELLFRSLAVEVLQGKMYQNSLPSGGGRLPGAKISGGKWSPPSQYVDTTRKAIDCATTLLLTFYIMKLCSRVFVLYCRNCPKVDKFTYFITDYKI